MSNKTLLFECEMSPLSLCVCGSHIMVLLRKVVIPIGSGALGEGVSYWRVGLEVLQPSPTSCLHIEQGYRLQISSPVMELL